MAEETGQRLYGHNLKDTQSLFHGHLLEVKSKKPQLHLTQYDFGVTALLFIAFLIFVWLYISNTKRLKHVIRSFYINRFANQLLREEFSLVNRVSVFLSIIFILVLTLFAGEIFTYYGWFKTYGYGYLLLVISLTIIVFYAIKITSIRFLGLVFKTTKESLEYVMTVVLFENTLGLFLLPVVIGLMFVKQASPEIFIYIGIGIILLFLLVRLIRGLMIGLNSPRISKFYLFLYLCALELLPLIVVVKLFLLFVK